jgi:hypothetical protein
MERIKIILNAGTISLLFFLFIFIIVKYRADVLRKYIYRQRENGCILI